MIDVPPRNRALPAGPRPASFQSAAPWGAPLR
jgi:hypothetical protein